LHKFLLSFQKNKAYLLPNKMLGETSNRIPHRISTWKAPHRIPKQSTHTEYPQRVPTQSTHTEYPYRVAAQSIHKEYTSIVPIQSNHTEFQQRIIQMIQKMVKVADLFWFTKEWSFFRAQKKLYRNMIKFPHGMPTQNSQNRIPTQSTYT